MREFFKATDRRFKVLGVSPELMLNVLFNPVFDGTEFVRCVSVEGLPPGCKVQAIIYDYVCDVFRFRLWHESFEEVPLGDCIPDVMPLFTVHTFRVERNTDCPVLVEAS